MKKTALIALVLLASLNFARAERIKDIVEIQGIRSNPLRGIGLVVGLADSGDTTLPSRQMLTNVLRNAGIVLEPRDLSGGNIAVVAVTAELGPFDREGTRIDVHVAAVGNASSLQGGILLPVPLQGLDGQVYAVAQGPLLLGGWGASGKQGSVSKNHQTVAQIPGGATVERAELANFIEFLGPNRFITLNLRNGDFETAKRISSAVNQLAPEHAIIIDPATIQVKIPNDISRHQVASFIAEITALEVKVDAPAVVVVNERTGTIIVGQNVSISPVAITQGSLVVKIRETASVYQPIAPFSNSGTTERVDETIISVEESDGHLIAIPHLVTVSDLAKHLNAIGATPRDLIAIFNALKRAGALQAKLEIM